MNIMPVEAVSRSFLFHISSVTNIAAEITFEVLAVLVSMSVVLLRMCCNIHWKKMKF